MQISPLDCWRPQPENVASFVAPPYDLFDRQSAKAYVQAHPESFLAIDRPETAFDEGQDPYAPEVYAEADRRLQQAARSGRLLHDVGPCLYLWRLDTATHSQIGVAAACSVDEYLDGTIRTHEHTKAEKVADRVNHIHATRAQTGPVLLFYRDNYAIDVLVSAASAADPLYDFSDAQGTHHTLWRIARPAALEAFEAAFSTVARAYIADGHHRSEASARICQQRREESGDAGKASNFLAVLFPASQLQAFSYDQAAAQEGQDLDQQGDPSASTTPDLVSLEEVMDAADAGRPMPPKSTWFEPKLPCGLFIRPI